MKGVFCTRQVTGDIPGDARSVLDRLEALFAGSHVYCLEQVHSDGIVLAEDISPGEIPEADAIISRNVDDILCVRTADCVPILAWSTDDPMIAAVHAGWRGLAAGIVEKTIRTMRSLGGKDIMAAIGPSIGPCCYEVRADVAQALQVDVEPDSNGSFFIDLKGAALIRLAGEGIAGEALVIRSMCTRCNADRFFSFRRDGDHAGRNISVVGGNSWLLQGLQVG